MELWFSEYHSQYAKFSIKVKEELFNKKSDYQHVVIMDTFEFGRVLVLDGYLMVTEKDEFIYHDMIVHVPMAVKPDAKRILVIGAGDGAQLESFADIPL